MEKIDSEVAEMEFFRFCEGHGINPEPVGVDEDERNNFVISKDRFLRAVESGKLVIDEDCKAIITLLPGYDFGFETITFREHTGADLLASDQRKEGRNIGKFFAMMASNTKLSPGTFSKLRSADNKLCQALMGLLLGE